MNARRGRRKGIGQRERALKKFSWGSPYGGGGTDTAGFVLFRVIRSVYIRELRGAMVVSVSTRPDICFLMGRTLVGLLSIINYASI